jgi:hypothetical protein
MNEGEKKLLQEANAMHEEIFARARAAGWEPVYGAATPKEGEPLGYHPDMPAPGYAFRRGGDALLVSWYPGSGVSIKQVLDWIESVQSVEP